MSQKKYPGRERPRYRINFVIVRCRIRVAILRVLHPDHTLGYRRISLWPGNIREQRPDTVGLHGNVRVIQQPVEFIKFTAVFRSGHAHLSSRATALSRHAKMAVLRPDREYELTTGFPYRLGDHSDDRTAGASAANWAAGWPGLRKRSSPPDAASGSARPNSSNRETKLTATTGRASGRVIN
jgi:hypothetical protein